MQILADRLVDCTWASLQNVTGFDEILSGQTSQIGAYLMDFGAGVGKSEAEVEKSGQKWETGWLTRVGMGGELLKRQGVLFDW